MRFRAPLLYEQYIGQYLTQEELNARVPASQPPKPGSPGTPTCPLSDLLLQSYQERELQQRLLQQQEEEEACLEEEEGEEDSDEEGEGQQQGGPCVQTPQPWARVSPLSMAPGWAPRTRADISFPSLPGQVPCVPWPFPACQHLCPHSSKAPSSVLPPGLCSYYSSAGMPLFTTLQVSGPDPVLCQSPERCIVIICLVCALGGQGWGHQGHCCVLSTKEAAVCSLPGAPPQPHPLWVSPPTDQNPSKDSEAWVPNSEERLILREEFTTRMHQRFLDGKDGDFDYRCSCAPTSPSSNPAPHSPRLHARSQVPPWRAFLHSARKPRTVPGHGPWGQTASGFQINQRSVCDLGLALSISDSQSPHL